MHNWQCKINKIFLSSKNNSSLLVFWDDYWCVLEYLLLVMAHWLGADDETLHIGQGVQRFGLSVYEPVFRAEELPEGDMYAGVCFVDLNGGDCFRLDG